MLCMTLYSLHGSENQLLRFNGASGMPGMPGMINKEPKMNKGFCLLLLLGNESMN